MYDSVLCLAQAGSRSPQSQGRIPHKVYLFPVNFVETILEKLGIVAAGSILTIRPVVAYILYVCSREAPAA
ncbi:hypothetical protein MASR2M48_14990 [Spirochaetota bacterium]